MALHVASCQNCSAAVAYQLPPNVQLLCTSIRMHQDRVQLYPFIIGVPRTVGKARDACSGIDYAFD